MHGELRAARRRLVTFATAAGMAAAALVTPALTAPASSADPCGPAGNEIACENTKPGTDPFVWDVVGAGDESIQGFATEISVNVGQRVDFKIDTDASAYTIDLYRTGYYQGKGARKVASVTPSVSLPQSQPNCISDPTTELYDCGNWKVSASWDVPADAVSGVYLAHLRRSNGDESHITFIVRDDASRSDLVFQTSDTTWHAYNDYGGASFYTGAVNGRAYKLSYNRPFNTRKNAARDFYFANEYPMVRFLEKNGYDVSYIAGVDTHRRGHLLTNHGTFLSVGHDEYWSGQQRANVEAARDAGVNLQFLSGNEMYWRTRFEPSIDGSSTSHRTLVSYKETWSNRKIDPSTEWTGTWRDPRFAPRSQGGGLPENGLTGTAYMVNYSDLPLTVSAAEGRLRLWRHTSLTSLPPGGSQALAPHTVGYESNEDLDNGHRPAGLIRLSTTTGPVTEYLQDYGTKVAPGTTTHHTTLYRAASGALVFSAGSVQWTWGLDAEHDSPYAPEPADRRMQQAQVNLLADMGAQPTTLDPALVATTASADSTGPTVQITSPAAGASIANGSRVTLTGTASDAGGRVAGVEVSTDGGQTWHPARGTTSWTHTYVQQGQGTVQLRVRATDDSANTGAAASRDVTVTCPCSVFGDELPQTPATTDTSAVELGLRFTPTTDGFVPGVRFYKGQGNGGLHEGSLWSAGGELLARGTFVDETATGWQTMRFTSAVPVSAGTTYVVSYSAPQGRYAMRADAFYDAPRISTPLRVEGGFGAAPAGVYGTPGRFPSYSYGSSHYYVDALFMTTDESPLVATARWPLPDSSSVAPGTTVSATFSKPLEAGTAGLVLRDPGGDPVAGATSYDAATRTITFTPSQPLLGFTEYEATLSGTDVLGKPVTAETRTWSFTTAKPPGPVGVCPCTLFDEATVPTVLEDPDTRAVTLGVRFAPAVDGVVTGVRFYKGPRNTGSHTGTLWSAQGAELATGTFSAESSSGWQTLTFSEPVPVTKDTEYYASYRTTVGRYSVTPHQFAATDLSRGPLRVSSNSGVYTYGTGYPNVVSANNYLVDLVFERTPAPLSIVAQEPAPGAVEVGRGAQVKVTFSTALRSTPVLAVTSGGTPVAGETRLSDDGTHLVFAPDALLPPDAQVDVTLSGAVSVEGVSLPPRQWSFRTRSGDDPVTHSLFTTQVPEVQAVAESSPVELGTAFTTARDGYVTGVRFFKGAGNTGVHTGSLWSATGTRLATVTFAGESSGGWQQALFSSPVRVTAGTTYVVSYLAPRGHYSASAGFFRNPLSNGDLTAPSGANGRYLYGAAGGFPTGSWNSTNYFVDVLFVRDQQPLTVTSRTPAPGAEDVVPTVRPSITFSDPIRTSGWSMTVEHGSTVVPGAAALSGTGRTLTFTPSEPLPRGAELTVTVTGVVSLEGSASETQRWTFTTEEAVSTLHSMFDALTPATAAAADDAAVELGVVFTPAVDGSVVGIRFFKGPGNTGTHTGSLWSAAGVRLGTVTFTGESDAGWQTATLATPVPVSAGTTYVASYYAPRGRYSVSGAFFSQPFTKGPLTAPAGNNGRYRYGAGGGFPTGSWNSTNYFVDVVLRQTSP